MKAHEENWTLLSHMRGKCYYHYTKDALIVKEMQIYELIHEIRLLMSKETYKYHEKDQLHVWELNSGHLRGRQMSWPLHHGIFITQAAEKHNPMQSLTKPKLTQVT